MRKITLENCHICLARLRPNPAYPESVSKYCPEDGDFFVQRLRGRQPHVVFRPFEIPVKRQRGPKKIKAVGISVEDVGKIEEVATEEPEPVRVGRWSYFGRTGRQAGHPGVIVECNETGKRYPSVKKAAEAMGISPGSISNQINGKQPKACGYTFTKIGDNIGELIE